MLKKNIPILRIFDVAKTKEFYIDWLGFEIEFEHVFEPGMPLYIGIKRDDITLHLSEHHGDSVPGVRIFIECNEIEKYLAELQSRPYKYYRPSVTETFYGTKEMLVQDPFGNKLSFNEYLNNTFA
jgi:catechol 2,3-dioxygenase-like lactoylglutathione lyase family enzyme